MYYDYAVTIPAGTPANSPVEQVLKLTRGIVHYLEVNFPAGCRGYAFLRLLHEGHQVWPTNPPGSFNAEEYTIPLKEYFPIVTAPYSLKAQGWSPEANFPHTLTVRVGILDEETLAPLGGLEKVLATGLTLIASPTTTVVYEPAPEVPEVVPPEVPEVVPPEVPVVPGATKYNTCPYCGKVFKDYDELRAHILSEHPWKAMPEPPPGWSPKEPEFIPGRGPAPSSPVHVDAHWCMRTGPSGYTIYYEAHMTSPDEQHEEYYRTSAASGAIAERIIDESQTTPDAIEAFLSLWPEVRGPGPSPLQEYFCCPYCGTYFNNYIELRAHVLSNHMPGITINDIYYQPGMMGYESAVNKIKWVDAKYYEKLAAGTLEPCGGYYQCPTCHKFFNTLAEFIAHQAEAHPD